MEYREYPVQEFNTLDFSGHWNVIIKKGKDCKLELAGEQGVRFQPDIKYVNSVMYLNNEMEPESDIRNVRVTAPYLKEIRGSGTTRFIMKNFWSDSIIVVLKDSSSFSGIQIDFDKITFRGPKTYESQIDTPND